MNIEFCAEGMFAVPAYRYASLKESKLTHSNYFAAYSLVSFMFSSIFTAYSAENGYSNFIQRKLFIFVFITPIDVVMCFTIRPYCCKSTMSS